MYTGDLYTAFNPYEFENIKTRLFILNHQRRYGNRSKFEASAYHRRNSDHYLFNRFSLNQNFVHDTKANALGLSGIHEINELIAINYIFNSATDEIDSSALEVGDFTTRNYYKISILPEYLLQVDEHESITNSRQVLHGMILIETKQRFLQLQN